MAYQDWIGLMIYKNFADQDWIGFKFIGSGLDSDWKISQSAHLCYLVTETSSVSSLLIARGYLRSNAQNRHPFYHLPVKGVRTLIFLSPVPILFCKFWIRIRYQLDTSNPTPVWVRVNISPANNKYSFFSKHKIQSGSGYWNENLTPDPVGGRRSPDPKSANSSPCTPEMSGVTFFSLRLCFCSML